MAGLGRIVLGEPKDFRPAMCFGDHCAHCDVLSGASLRCKPDPTDMSAMAPCQVNGKRPV